MNSPRILKVSPLILASAVSIAGARIALADAFPRGKADVDFEEGVLLLEPIYSPKKQPIKGHTYYSSSSGVGFQLDPEGFFAGILDHRDWQAPDLKNSYLYLDGDPEHFWYSLLTIQCQGPYFVNFRSYSEMYRYREKIDHNAFSNYFGGLPAKNMLFNMNPWIFEPLVQNSISSLGDILENNAVYNALCADGYGAQFKENKRVFWLGSTETQIRNEFTTAKVIQKSQFFRSEKKPYVEVKWDLAKWDAHVKTQMKRPQPIQNLEQALREAHELLLEIEREKEKAPESLQGPFQE